MQSYLLLPNEKLYFTNDFNGHLFEDGQAFSVNYHHGPNDIHSVYRFSSPRYELLPNSEVIKNPRLPCLNYPPYYLLRLITILPTLLDGMQLTACRRAIIHRHLYMFIHYLDRTSKFWFSKCWSHEKDMRSVSNKLEQSSVNTTISESSSDTEPLTNITSYKSLRRTTRNTSKNQLTMRSESSELSRLITKPLYSSNESPTVTSNSQLIISVNLKDINKDSNTNVPLTSSITTTPSTVIISTSPTTVTGTKFKHNSVDYPSTDVTFQSQVKHTTRSAPLLSEKLETNYHTTTTLNATTTNTVSTTQGSLDQNIRMTRSVAMLLKRINSGPNLRSHSLRGK